MIPVAQERRAALQRGQELTLRLESFAFEGKNVARLDGLVVFVHGGVPGDEVRARITKVKKQFVEAEVTDVLVQSPLRVEPRCRYFSTCGGCKWQHVAYNAQREFKRQHVIDALERIGGFTDVQVEPTIGAEDSYFYRNKMEFSFGERWLTKEEYKRRQEAGEGRQELDAAWSEHFALGLHIPGRFDRVLDLDECWLQSKTSAAIVNCVREFCRDRKLTIYSTRTHTGYLRNLVIREGKCTGERMVNLVTSEDRPDIMQSLAQILLQSFPSITTIVNNITQRKSLVAIGDEERVYHGPGYITERIGKRIYRVSANSFFQTNTLQAGRLYDTARQMSALQSGDVVYDLYSGTGTIALHIADDVREVVGIEVVESAVEDAKTNAALNNVSNCTFITGDLKDRLTKDTAWLANRPPPTVMIIDPPRSGMHEKVVMEVKRMQPDRIVYVSCNPATQARDLKLLCSDGMYRIRGIQPVDMFPHTFHIETVVAVGKS